MLLASGGRRFNPGSSGVALGSVLRRVNTLQVIRIHFNAFPLSCIILNENSIGKTKNEIEGPVIAV
jgi:hypothetical protein